MDWRTGDTAPRDGTWIIACHHGGLAFPAKWVGGDYPWETVVDAEGGGSEIDAYDEDAVTHWAPMPHGPPLYTRPAPDQRREALEEAKESLLEILAWRTIVQLISGDRLGGLVASMHKGERTLASVERALIATPAPTGDQRPTTAAEHRALDAALMDSTELVDEPTGDRVQEAARAWASGPDDDGLYWLHLSDGSRHSAINLGDLSEGFTAELLLRALSTEERGA